MSKKYPMKHNIDPIHNKRANGPVISFNNLIYHGVDFFSVSEFNPNLANLSAA